MGATSSLLRRSARHPSGQPCPLVGPPALWGISCGDPLTAFPQPGPPPGRTAYSVLGLARPPMVNPLAITLGPATAPIWVQSLPFAPILKASRSASRASGSPPHFPSWLELGPPVARESGGDTDSVVPRSFRRIPLFSVPPEYSVHRLAESRAGCDTIPYGGRIT
ncbi:hypothetical protein BD309DRAFT_316163 [Dichomitus squalens]|nr:hypothetical protein BD309DRAFT_316163 [Dichomitus squalens]